MSAHLHFGARVLTCRMTYRRTRIRMLSQLALTFFAAACVSAACLAQTPPESTPSTQRREAVRRFDELRKSDPTRALQRALREMSVSARLPPGDPRRADSAELLALAYMTTEQWPRALAAINDVVRLRRHVSVLKPELLADALVTQGAVLFALQRPEEADAALSEHLALWRQVFAATDLRLAEKLEQNAEHVQKGFGRRVWVIELLREAVDIRQKHPPSGRLAQTLQELAIHEMLQQELGNAQEHLALADNIIRNEMLRLPQDQERRAGLAQVLVMRSGICASSGMRVEAAAFMEQARQLHFQDRTISAATTILIAQARGEQLRRAGLYQDAIDAQAEALDMLERSQDLVDRGALDSRLFADVFMALGQLYMETGELGLAAKMLQTAQKGLGEMPELLFLRSELAQRSGQPNEALKLYQLALKQRKQAATEATVLFGTTRRPATVRVAGIANRGSDGRFNSEDADRLTLGQAQVLVPGAQFSAKAWLPTSRPEAKPFGQATDASELLIRARRVLDDISFAATVTQQQGLARSKSDAVLVFVHGFNVSFDQAVQRAAQLKRDLNFEGALFVFSWPSRGEFWRYGTDRDTSNRAGSSLLAFLGQIQRATGASRMHLLAHSMGNRVLLSALSDANAVALAPRIGEVILAAPAVPKGEFAALIDRAAANGINSFTLYASKSDKAMWVGAIREGSTLAGFAANGQPLLHPKVQSIDLSMAGSSGMTDLNHDVFTSNPVMTEDIRQLLSGGRQRTPNERLPLLRCSLHADGVRYWRYDATAQGPSDCAR
jgi:esterase/lipase superfamily enzyme